MRIVLPALALSSFMGFRGAAEADFLTNAFLTPPPATLLARSTEIRPPAFTVNEVVRAAGRKHKVAPAFIKGVMAAESSFNPAAVSDKGAMGLMQLMPDTARENGAVDLQDPDQNIEAGTVYLKKLLVKYGDEGKGLQKAVAAYNAGPGNVDKYRGIPPFKETRSYVKRVLSFYKFFSLKRNS